MSSMREKAVEGLKAGDSFEITRTFGQAETEAFGHLTRDYNPVHYDQPFCREKGLEGLICHGLLVASMICQVGGQIAWLASGMNFRFRRPVYFGDTITCRLVISEVDDNGRALAQAVYRNQHGQVVQEAQLRGYLPAARERERLEAMTRAGDPTNPLV
ncbi:MAG: MaoC family dehydratase [Pseudomonadota bacterium]